MGNTNIVLEHLMGLEDEGVRIDFLVREVENFRRNRERLANPSSFEMSKNVMELIKSMGDESNG